MSYDIELVDPVTREPLLLDAPHQMRGGTYCMSGEPRAHLNVTYNYAKHLYRVMDADRGIRSIYGLTGAESVDVLKGAIAALGDDASDDYWEATEGNVKRALAQLLALALMRPDGVWDGD